MLAHTLIVQNPLPLITVVHLGHLSNTMNSRQTVSTAPIQIAPYFLELFRSETVLTHLFVLRTLESFSFPKENGRGWKRTE